MVGIRKGKSHPYAFMYVCTITGALARNVGAGCRGMQGPEILMSSKLLDDAEVVNEGPSVR